eukprot:2768765-Pleurochrysis_carterae.AAC.1
MLSTSSRLGLLCLIALSDLVVAMPSLLRMLTFWALSVNLAGVEFDLRSACLAGSGQPSFRCRALAIA